MKKNLLILSCLLLSSISYAQSSLTVEAGQNFTTLKYTNDDPDQIRDYTRNFSSSLNIGFEYALPQGVFFNSKVGLRKGGASYVYDDFNYRWDLNYAEVRLGLGYRYNWDKISVQFSTQGYYGYLYKAEQRLHNTTRDMLLAGTYEDMDAGLFFSPGVYYKLAENLSLGLDLNYMLGLMNIETDEGQETKNELMGTSLGLRINL